MRMVLPGSRIVKTAVAIFLTAFICNLIGWPPVFAVITAIVTLEPTVADSIKKGIVRFPASAIGSFYAVLFIALFGNSPITYTLAATLTIITCYRLKLHAGLLVATITAVAMIEVIYDNYLLSFFIRLGTTTIGIVVSTLVNLLILPPNYKKEIDAHLKKTYKLIGNVLTGLLETKHDVNEDITKIMKQIDKAEEFIRHQQNEAFFHPLLSNKRENFDNNFQQIKLLRIIRYHISNLNETNIDNKTIFNDDEKELIILAKRDLASYFTENRAIDTEHYDKQLRRLIKLFWTSNRPVADQQLTLPQGLIILYELISIFQLVQQLKELEN